MTARGRRSVNRPRVPSYTPDSLVSILYTPNIGKMPATLVVAALLLVTVVKRCRSCLLPTLLGENCLLDPCLLLNPCGTNSQCSAVFDLQGNVLADVTQCICLSDTLQGNE